MASLYTLQLKNPNSDLTLSRNISVADRRVTLNLTWPTHIEEQYNIIMQYFKARAQSDPLVTDDEYIRTYDYCEYYLPLFNKTEAQLREWIQQTSVLPQSIRSGTNDNEKYARLQNNLTVCKSAWPLIEQYRDLLCWNFQLLRDGIPTTGVVRPGGWYRTDDAELQFRFVADTDSVGKADLEVVTIEFEIGQDL